MGLVNLHTCYFFYCTLNRYALLGGPLAVAEPVCSCQRWQRKPKPKKRLHIQLFFTIYTTTMTWMSSVASPSATTRRHYKCHIGTLVPLLRQCYNVQIISISGCEVILTSNELAWWSSLVLSWFREMRVGHITCERKWRFLFPFPPTPKDTVNTVNDIIVTLHFIC